MKKPRTIRGVALILLLLVLLPLLVFTAFEISRLSASESVVAEIYRRQLDIALLSINQFAWDVANTWAGAVERAWEPSAQWGEGSPVFAGGLLAKNPAIDMVFVADSLGENIRALNVREGDPKRERSRVAALLAAGRPTINRLLKFARQNYRKIEPLAFHDSSGPDGRVALLFVARETGGDVSIAGISLQQDKFVREVLGERMREAAAGEYDISVVRLSNGDSVFASDQGSVAEPEQRRQLWLFPDLAVGIRLRGETIQRVAHARASGDLAKLIVLDAVLLTGIWVVYRSVRKEMEFVRLKSDFVSNVSHDLRTPLALIRMYAETLEMGRLAGEEKRREYYTTIVKETERLTRLVNNLLNFSRMEAGRKPYNLLPLDLNGVVAGVLDSFGPHLKSEGFAPLLELDPRIPPVPADAEAVQEALINILDNAVKYSAADKYLRVATAARGGAVVIDIQDHGEGIPREFHEKIFETFFRVPAPGTGRAKGSGLGLAIARHIMEAHGGRIDVQSGDRSGSTFTLAFRYDHHSRH